MGDVSRHHVYFPRRDYQTRVEKIFRTLPCHVVVMSVEGHRRLHQLAFRDNGTIPTKPSEEDMIAKINHCHNECRGRCKNKGE